MLCIEILNLFIVCWSFVESGIHEGQGHQCNLKCPNFQTSWPRLIFFDVETVRKSSDFRFLGMLIF